MAAAAAAVVVVVVVVVAFNFGGLSEVTIVLNLGTYVRLKSGP